MVLTCFNHLEKYEFVSWEGLSHILWKIKAMFQTTNPLYQWEFQDPKMEVLYHISPYFGGIFPYIGLTLALYMVGTSNLGSWNGH